MEILQNRMNTISQEEDILINKRYNTICHRDQSLLRLFGIFALLIIGFVVIQVITVAPEFAAAVIAAAIATIGVLWGILFQIGLFLKKNKRLAYDTELAQKTAEQEEEIHVG